MSSMKILPQGELDISCQQNIIEEPLFGLSVVIPVYNGSQTIGQLVQHLSQLNIKEGLEIVLVDDGSEDNSAEVCEGLVHCASKVPVTLVKLARNFGEHNAVMAGLRFARGAYIITMDDDLQNPPSEVEKLYRYACESGKHVVYTFYEEKKHSWYRNLGSKFANWTANRVMDKPKQLYLSSFRCLSSFVAHEISIYQGPFPYIDGLIFQTTNSVDSIQVDHLVRKEGRSNYNLTRLLRLWISIALNFSTIPLRVISFIGFVASAMSLILFVDVVWEYLFVGINVGGWTSMMATILFFSGTQLIMLGVVGEYIGRTYMSLSRRPQYVVEALLCNPSNAT